MRSPPYLYIVTKLMLNFSFQEILDTNSDMRQRVEQAVIKQKERQKAESLATQPSLSQPSQPSIKLKMDFSNFK